MSRAYSVRHHTLTVSVLRIRAGLVLPMTAPPIEDGAVLVDATGRIAAVGPHAQVPVPGKIPRFAFPDGVLVPGLVNCHTHLELSHLAGCDTSRSFPTWIAGVRTRKDSTTPEEFRVAAEAGVRECWAWGVTCVADTGSTGAVIEVLARTGGRGVCYQEVFGPDPTQTSDSMTALAGLVTQLRRFASARVGLGVSPHAPYTVSESLYRAVADFARQQRLPVAVHVAESPEETALVRDGAGPFAAALGARGITVPPRGQSPIAYLAGMGVITLGTLCIHCVQLDAADVVVLAKSGAAVAHCPRSNAAHNHGQAPATELRRAGVPLGLGTDSVASVADLNLRAEVAEAALSGDAAWRSLTLDGARALGLGDDIGSLEPGKAGDLVVFAAGDGSGPGAVGPALLTTVAGRVVHRT